MALFGVDQPPETACRQGLAAAKAIALEQLNEELAHDLSEPLRIGIGLHVGLVILGEMGFGRAATLTAIGDTVNVGARLEALTKEFDVQMVASTRLSERAGIDLSAFEDRWIEIRGRQRPLRVKLVGDARTLPLEAAPAAGKGASAPVWLAEFGRRRLRSGDRDPRGAGRTAEMG
jgi:adenylate cyclase